MAENKPLTSLRGFAALIVVAYHVDIFYYHDGGMLHPVLKGGIACVDIFFILSGFILAKVYWDLPFKGISAFFIKRIFRLYPLHIFVMLLLGVMVGVASLAHIPLNSKFPWGTYPAVLLLLQPFLYSEPVGWNTPSWSIGIELACYALFPLGIAALREASQRLCLIIFALLCVLEFFHLRHYANSIAGYGALWRGMVGFFSGASLCAMLRPSPMPRKDIISLLEWLGVAGVIASLIVDIPWGVALTGALLIGSLSFDAGVIAGFLRRQEFVWLGRISFSVYLTHFPVLMILGKSIAPWRLPFPGAVADVIFIGISMATILVVSAFTYRYVETPGRRAPEYLHQLHGGQSVPN